MRGNRYIVFGGICLAAFSCTSAFGQGKVKVIKPKQTPAPVAQSSEPDKVLYDRAMADLKKKRYVEERLSLETLINTYPDSEYLDQAKLAVADSYYTEGGVSNLTQAIGEYKSFVVFFPFDDKASYAQMQVGMSHYKMMEKSDRDTSEALSAESELQTFLTKYPNDKFAPVAEQKLRDVQEVIADGEFKVARFYYLRPDYRASAARLVELTERYPLYSGSGDALWMLGDIYAVMKNKGSRNEDDKNHWADLEGKVLDRIVTDYPLSPRATQAKTQLKAMGMAVPAADPMAVAQMQKQETFIKAHRQSMMKQPLAMMKTGPDLSTAAQSGMPNLTPPADSITAKDILSPTTAGPTFNLAADAGAGGGGTDVSGGGASITSVNDAAPSPAASNDPNANAIVSAPTTASGNGGSPASSDPVGQVDAPTTSSSDTTPAPATTASGNSAAQGSTAAASQGGTATAPATPGTESSSKNESSSKKKKGLGKLNPF